MEISMYEDWPEAIKVLSAQLHSLRGGAPEIMKAFSAIAQTALATTVLDTKTKELIALGIGVAIRCDDCIAFHVKAALQQGATREEISETLGMAIYMGAGPSVMYASHAFAALEQFDAVNTTKLAGAPALADG
jgi:AhpD family alkylhydroperoxidase